MVITLIWERAVNDANTAVMYIDLVHNPVSAKKISDAFDEILSAGGIRTVVIASRDEKIWCMGLDVPWIMEQYKAGNRAAVKELFAIGTQYVFRRILSVPVVTIAAITGHAFGTGMILAVLCDFLFMRSDRGYLCLPEADMGIVEAIPPSARKLFDIRYDPFIKTVMIPTAKKVTALELKEKSIIEQACEGREAVMAAALSRAREVSASEARFRDLLEKRKQWSVPVIAAMDEEDSVAFDYMVEKFWGLMGRISK